MLNCSQIYHLLISLTLSCHFSLSFITPGRASGLHPVFSHSCCMYVRAVGVHRITALMRSSQLLQQCPACLIHLTRIVFVMGGRWPYSWCLFGCCHQETNVCKYSNYLLSLIQDDTQTALFRF